MMRPPIPFDVLAQVGPVLAWVEGGGTSRLPLRWTPEDRRFADRERGWLLQQLPDYSFDNVDEVVRGGRKAHRAVGGRAVLAADIGEGDLSPPADYDLVEACRFLSNHYFVWSGGEMRIREGRMEELHELGIRFPVGHVLRHAHARAISEAVLTEDDALALPERASLLPSNSMGMRSVIREGIVEGHLHVNSVISAEEHWAENMLKPFTAGAIARQSAAERRLLVLNRLAGHILALAVWVSEGSERRHWKELGDVVSLFDGLYFARTRDSEYWVYKLLEEKLREVTSAVLDPRGPLGASLEEQPREAWWLLRWIAPATMGVLRLAPAGAFGSGVANLGDYRRLVHRLHLRAHTRLVQLPRYDARWALLHEALFRYMVCRTHHWQQATQSGRTTGLRSFRRFFKSKQRRPTGLSELQYAALVLERLREWRGLRVVEGRISPPASGRDLVPWVLAYARDPKHRRVRKFGLVVHFIKEKEERDERWLQAMPVRGESVPELPRLRWGKRRRIVRRQALNLYRLLSRPTPLALFVVGIDAANLELETPPEVFAPVFRFLRELPIQFRPRCVFETAYDDIEPAIRKLAMRRQLGMTYHVGEDFRHLLSGMRAIFEVLEFLAPQPGDRLGHAIALGLDPKDWCEHNGFQAVVPKLEWLDTLVWVHHFLGPGHSVTGALGLEDKIQRLSWEIYSEASGRAPILEEALAGARHRRRDVERNPAFDEIDWSPLALYDAWLLRQLDPYSLNLAKLFEGELELLTPEAYVEEERRWHHVQDRIHRKVEESVGSRKAYLLLGLYWLDVEARRRGAEVAVIDMGPERELWIALCSDVQEKLKGVVHKKELVVEVNPSANRIIGPMAAYGQHHAFRLTLDANDHLMRHVRVSVNTDNPATCHTSLAHEYYLLGEILMNRGVSEAEVVRWLEWLRDNGKRYSFAERLPDQDDPAMGQIIERLRRIRPTVREAPTREDKLLEFWRWQKNTELMAHGLRMGASDEEAALHGRLLELEARMPAPMAPSRTTDPD